MAYGNGTNAPYGLKPAGTLTGAPLTLATRVYSIASGYATNIGENDPVIQLADGTIGIGVAGSVSMGVFQGCQYYDATGVLENSPYWPANTVVKTGTTVTAYVAIDPHYLFDVQTNTVGGCTLSMIGKNANFAIGATNTATGVSTTVLDLASVNTTATLNCKIVALVAAPGNDYGVPYNSVLVTLNNHTFNAGVAGI